jgi:[acyl-carrier-protein] S-malonyltransferase
VNVAFLFPGQGSEVPRMGLGLARSSRAAADLLDVASQAAQVDVWRVLERGGLALDRTEVLQPLLVAVSLGALAALERAGVRASLVAGHSLGELCAWCAAGGVAAVQAVTLAGLRGRLMAAASRRHPGGMVALRRCSEANVEDALERGRTAGAVDLAAHNGPDDWVISGDAEALHVASLGLPAVPLRVAGPWHGRWMAPAVEPLRAILGAVPRARAEATATLVSNRTGEVVAATDSFPDMLAEQLRRPVRFAGTLATLARHGVTDIVTVGPGHVLRSLVRGNLGARTRIHATDTPRSLASTIEALS